jgi:short-subunit dehydrogenase
MPGDSEDRVKIPFLPEYVLVNNAAGDFQREFHHYTTDDVEVLIQLDPIAPIELTRLLLPGMLQHLP